MRYLLDLQMILYQWLNLMEQHGCYVDLNIHDKSEVESVTITCLVIISPVNLFYFRTKCKRYVE